MSNGEVKIEISNNIAQVEFFHPKGNSLPKSLLKELASEIKNLDKNPEAKVIVIKSRGESAFCAGASFDELKSISNFEEGKEFFMGFARLILAMKKCSKLIITKVQGKAVGGGVGIVAASDYVIAIDSASIKLSELDLGIGPFVIGPAVERKIGSAAFSALAIDTNWRDAAWAKLNNLFTEVYYNLNELEAAVNLLAAKLAKNNPEALSNLKNIFWEGTDHWEKLLENRAEISGKLVLSEHTANFINSFQNKK